MLNKLKPVKFFEQVKQEAKRVTWPDRKELTTSVLIILVTVLVFSVAVMIIDYGIHNFVGFILNIGK